VTALAVVNRDAEGARAGGEEERRPVQPEALPGVTRLVDDEQIENTSAGIDTSMSRRKCGVLWSCSSARRHLICAEMPLAAANDGLFPERFKRLSKSGVPAFGIIESTSVASVAILVNYLGSSGATAFTTLVLMTGITAAIPYAFSALAQIKWRRADQRTLKTPHFLRDMIVAILALVFSILFIVYSRNTGHSFWIYWAPFLLAGVAMLAGIPVYRSVRNHMTEPDPAPPYR
jgi:amino acid transporter